MAKGVAMKNALALGALIAVFLMAFPSGNTKEVVKEHSQTMSREKDIEDAVE